MLHRFPDPSADRLRLLMRHSPSLHAPDLIPGSYLSTASAFNAVGPREINALLITCKNHQHWTHSRELRTKAPELLGSTLSHGGPCKGSLRGRYIYIYIYSRGMIIKPFIVWRLYQIPQNPSNDIGSQFVYIFMGTSTSEASFECPFHENLRNGIHANCPNFAELPK